VPTGRKGDAGHLFHGRLLLGGKGYIMGKMTSVIDYSHLFEVVDLLQVLVDSLRSGSALEGGGEVVSGLLGGAAGLWPTAHRRLVARSGAYTRTSVYRDARFEVLLLNWAPGAISAIHDHGGQFCWMTVLEGRLEVEDYVRLDAGEVLGYARIEPRGSRTLERGEIDSRGGRFDLHRVGASYDAPAVSLHVYAGPLHRFLVYDELSRRCETAIGTYDDVLSVDAVPSSR